MAGRRFAVVQEYVPEYRVPLFRALADAARVHGDEFIVYAGHPTGALAERGDAAENMPWLRSIRQRELKLFGRRLTFRLLPRSVWTSDLIVVEQARRNMDLPVLMISSKTAAKTALWGHGPDVVKAASRFDRWYSRTLIRRATWFFAYTQSGERWAAAAGLDRERITVLSNTIDTTRLRTDLEAEQAGTVVRPFQAGFIGALDAGKGIEELIAIGIAVQRSVPEFRLVVGGDGPLRGVVEAAAARHPWLEYRGSVGDATKARLLLESELLVVPGRVGLVAVDSLVAGRPIITLASSMHAPEFEYLAPGETCVVAHDVAGAARAVTELLGDRIALETMQGRCRQESWKFSIEEMARRFDDGLQTAVKVDNG